MKHFIFLAAVAMLLTSCHHAAEVPLETDFPIVKTFTPEAIEIDKNDTELVEKCISFNDRQFVIRSREEFPDDMFGFTSDYTDINFELYTLIVTYDFTRFIPSFTDFRYYRNNEEKQYNLVVHQYLRQSDLDNSSSDPDSFTRYFRRYAVIVRKNPTSDPVKVWFSYSTDYWTDS